MRPKIDNIIENRSILDKSVKPKSLVLARILLFCAVRIKFTYFPTAPYVILNIENKLNEGILIMIKEGG